MFIFDVHDVFAFVEYRYHGRATVAKDGADLPAGAVRSCKLPQNLVDTAGACSSNDPRTMRGSRGAPLSVCSLSRLHSFHRFYADIRNYDDVIH